MKNVTVSLKENVVRWARISAAEQGKSLSRFLGTFWKSRWGTNPIMRPRAAGSWQGNPSLSGSPAKSSHAR